MTQPISPIWYRMPAANTVPASVPRSRYEVETCSRLANQEDLSMNAALSDYLPISHPTAPMLFSRRSPAG